MGVRNVAEIPFSVPEEQLALSTEVGDDNIRVPIPVHVADVYSFAGRVAREVLHLEVALAVIQEDPVDMVTLLEHIPFDTSRSDEINVSVPVEVGSFQTGVVTIRIVECLTARHAFEIRYTVPIAVRPLEINHQTTECCIVNRIPGLGYQEVPLPVLVHVDEPDAGGPVPIRGNVVSWDLEDRTFVKKPVQKTAGLAIRIPDDNIRTSDKGILRSPGSNPSARKEFDIKSFFPPDEDLQPPFESVSFKFDRGPPMAGPVIGCY